MSVPDWVPVREELRDEEPYGAPQIDVPVRLNTNENPYGPSEAAADDIAASVRAAALGLNRYPDREAWSLRTALAAYLTAEVPAADLDASQVWAANGSNEVMQQILQAFGGPGRTALSFAPTYSMYPEYARNTHTRWVAGQRREDFGIDAEAAVALIETEQPDVVFLTSPNNPTGTALDPAHTRAVLEAAPGVVVVDEAYAEFRREGTPSALELLEEFPRLVVTRTMSKAFALAGGRLGYLAAHADVVDALRIVRLPYHLSSVTQATAEAALRHTDELLAQVDALRATRDATAARLREHGFTVADSDANFILFGTFENRHATWQALVDRGVLIRETGPLGWLRVSIGTPSEMDAFFTALKEVTS
ncbi:MULTISPECIES: histidinol-phosphate transaminase [unclassified Aeromicrobium]|uniref:histidinol-phosphate transaminase n=1 Tax=unclassified Aeromicrobium TaxID=2633570 RepID=UPI00288940D3|nr:MULTISPECIES: histidinol-phosphate transaminase [unclassified Aeromicrobium]